MDAFVLDDESLKKGWGDDGQYWFSLDTYTIKNHYDFADNERPEDMSESEFMLSMHCIPYFRVSRVELAKAYIDAVASDKLKKQFASVDDDEQYVEMFWKCFKAYKHLSDGYEDFQNQYLIKKAIDWCDENEIEYVLK